jgi:hypothetical protein
MQHSRKEKPPEKELVYPMIYCAFVTLLLFGGAALAFIHRGDFVIKKETVPISTYNSLLDLLLTLTTQIPLYLGIGFLWVTYAMFRAYRKCKLAKKDDSAV